MTLALVAFLLVVLAAASTVALGERRAPRHPLRWQRGPR